MARSWTLRKETGKRAGFSFDKHAVEAGKSLTAGAAVARLCVAQQSARLAPLDAQPSSDALAGQRPVLVAEHSFYVFLLSLLPSIRERAVLVADLSAFIVRRWFPTDTGLSVSQQRNLDGSFVEREGAEDRYYGKKTTNIR